MKTKCMLLIVLALVAFCGCSKTGTEPTVAPPDTSAKEPLPNPDDPAEYAFHRDVAITDVTKTLPDGSVDHIDFDADANPSVVVVVTLTSASKEGLRFTTTFTGEGDLSIKKDWAPASVEEGKEYRALFVLPAEINAGFTVVH